MELNAKEVSCILTALELMSNRVLEIAPEAMDKEVRDLLYERYKEIVDIYYRLLNYVEE